MKLLRLAISEYKNFRDVKIDVSRSKGMTLSLIHILDVYKRQRKGLWTIGLRSLAGNSSICSFCV